MQDFYKYHGLGNDFIIFNSLDSGESLLQALSTEKISSLCQAKYGIGADGVIVLLESERADFSMKLFNPDGSQAELSGNGLRCLALCISDLGLTDERKFRIETMAGLQKVEIMGEGLVKVWMPIPDFKRSRIPMVGDGECVNCRLDFEGEFFEVTAVSLGNPHCVIFEPFNVGQALEWGPIVEDSNYFPSRTNVEFVEVKGDDRLRAIIYERGAGLTEACGSGACAAVAAGIKTGRLKFNLPYTVELLGGNLTVTILKDYSEVILEGEAKKVFEGRVEL